MPTIIMRGGNPAICVKDKTVWAQMPEVREIMEDLGDATVDAIYEGVRQDFWDYLMPELAEQFGYARDAIGCDGRSGGWLVLSGTTFLDHVNLDDPTPSWAKSGHLAPSHVGVYTERAYRDREQFFKFALAVEQTIAAAGDTFMDTLRQVLDEKNAKREACLVRGEN